MTPRQQECYRAIKKHMQSTRMSPTLCELAKRLGCTHSNVRTLLRSLERRKIIARQPGLPRSIRLLAQSEKEALGL